MPVESDADGKKVRLPEGGGHQVGDPAEQLASRRALDHQDLRDHRQDGEGIPPIRLLGLAGRVLIVQRRARKMGTGEAYAVALMTIAPAKGASMLALRLGQD